MDTYFGDLSGTAVHAGRTQGRAGSEAMEVSPLGNPSVGSCTPNQLDGCGVEDRIPAGWNYDPIEHYREDCKDGEERCRT